jgi:predicted glycogen debranching enzyme
MPEPDAHHAWPALPRLRFGPGITSDLNAAMQHEWLVTNGRGGYAFGTLSEANTRSYHGLLIAPLTPPLGRTLLVSKLAAELVLRDHTYKCDTNEWASGAVAPEGFKLLESFEVEGRIPIWTYALAEARLEKRVWMAHDRDTTYVTYTHRRGDDPMRLKLKVLCTYRDHHSRTHSGLPLHVESESDLVVRIFPNEDRPPYWLQVHKNTFMPLREWYHNMHYRAEALRGLEPNESVFAAGEFEHVLQPGETFSVTLTLEAETQSDWRTALEAERERERGLIDRAGLGDAPEWIQHLALAADQFVVKRGDGGRTIIAGYPWFGDWGRDTMIALPGLLLALHRVDEATSVLRTFARYLDRGLLPNRFLDPGESSEALEYNTVDATLWYVHAIDRALDAGADAALGRELYPALVDIIDWHVRGTHHNIHVDEDGLLYAGESGVQLTWMDARVDDWVVTPRIGKPVEINALWIHALRIAARLAAKFDRIDDQQRFTSLAEKATHAFRERFWQGEYLYDVIDGPDGNDARLRPNQLFVVALEPDLLTADQARAVLQVCERELLVPLGVRSLSPRSPDYKGRYSGDQRQRDAAYHQGTVWTWLMGAFVQAHYAVYRDAAAAREYLEPFALHLEQAGIGTISEILEGDPPYAPRGCPAQAWSVAEVLRMWIELGMKN